MSKPTPKELEAALHKAKEMRDHQKDPYLLAKCLLSHNYRIHQLEEVLQAADRYINLGMSEHDHSTLVRAIEKAKDMESFTSHIERDSFGLE